MALPAHRYHVEISNRGVFLWNLTRCEAERALVGLMWLPPPVPYLRLATILDDAEAECGYRII